MCAKGIKRKRDRSIMVDVGAILSGREKWVFGDGWCSAIAVFT